MSKGFFVGTILFLFVGTGLVIADQLDVAPAPIAQFFDFIEANVPFFAQPAAPYMEKFEGNWAIALNPGTSQSDIATCVPIQGTIESHNGLFSGSIGPFGAILPFHASTTQSGILTGNFGGATLHIGQVTAKLENGQGTGSWTDNYGCNGMATFVKQDAVVDPIQGKIVSAQGDVELVRGGEDESVIPGAVLYAGDHIITGTDGAALVGLGSDSNPVNVPASAQYIVPQVQKY